MEQDKDIDIERKENNDSMQYPFVEQLEKMDYALQSRSKSVIEFLGYIGSQLHASNDMNLKQYIESIKKQMYEYWNLSKPIRQKYDAQKLLHKLQVLMQENRETDHLNNKCSKLSIQTISRCYVYG